MKKRQSYKRLLNRFSSDFVGALANHPRSSNSKRSLLQIENKCLLRLSFVRKQRTTVLYSKQIPCGRLPRETQWYNNHEALI